MPDFDLKMLGDEALIRKLNRLPKEMRGKAVRPALKASAQRVHAETLTRLHAVWGQRTGRLHKAFGSAKVKAVKTKGGVKYGSIMPTREELGIAPAAKHFFPIVLEYERSWIRNVADRMKGSEFTRIGSDIGRKIESLFASIK